MAEPLIINADANSKLWKEYKETEEEKLIYDAELAAQNRKAKSSEQRKGPLVHNDQTNQMSIVQEADSPITLSDASESSDEA